ncbi:hypothetical protein [Aliiglaciecola sp. NS0011-25]|uniref:hypothetical protein n=1 Tax=Aliiglaciecola sp. NS0011-25 TaxID=3127654 RepID=UPI003108E932
MNLSIEDLFSIVVNLSGWLVFLLATIFVPKYLGAKAKGLAQKEDVEAVTRIVEKIRKEHAKDLELLKGEIQSNLGNQELKRKVYSDFVKSLYVFNDGNKDETLKDLFIDSYSLMWVWAPDEVLLVLKDFVQLQTDIGKGLNVNQDDVKASYSKCILVLRKDIYNKTELESSDYKFPRF